MNYLGFWNKFKKLARNASDIANAGRPIFVLAPMADVTDVAFRQIICKYGKPDVFWTEFVSADGLAHPLARKKLLIDLKYSKNEHPIVAQIFGAKPENIKKASALCKKLGFDGVDINMGCPDRSVEKQGAGASLIKNPKLAKEIIRTAKEGARGLPISVKTRIGYNRNEIETWVRELLEEDVAVLTIHLRTRKEMSNVPAHWELMKRIVEIRDEMKKDTLIFGNGDVVDIDDARRKCKEAGCDGVMLGRAIFGNPWLFAPSPFQGEGRGEVSFLNHHPLSPPQQGGEEIKHKLQVMIEHTKLFEKLLGKHKNFAIMKKHYKAYVNGFKGAKELRIKLMEAENAKEVEEIIEKLIFQIY
ncbi:tRNA-dihydrouridine synthase [Candidatus Nomurabacteria bacterium CG10_big_fil_rev_8_21_14_0_10_35_16]|uniref:tRNA-dihydrouridine synthase n=1 Tax=Candidatus Nomurabacteria bacterium CG10_big_fil_rev_8_21_14_0_10_35_16 TaxID=1974731 RepID=A0A2H0TCT5_9BACT|nr:MAG: tRNA-dihydrouridine synthase [Candidatus Nomurabacteria bacterium CG10_big_fil_rev_8_21_14_0_10_35_16]